MMCFVLGSNKVFSEFINKISAELDLIFWTIDVVKFAVKFSG